MSCYDEKRPFEIYEWSDTILDFTLTEKTQEWETPLDLSEFDEVRLILEFANWEILEVDWTLDWEDISLVSFELLSESTVERSWKVMAEIWWLHWEDKVRLSETFEWLILHSIKIPVWTVQES